MRLVPTVPWGLNCPPSVVALEPAAHWAWRQHRSLLCRQLHLVWARRSPLGFPVLWAVSADWLKMGGEGGPCHDGPDLSRKLSSPWSLLTSPCLAAVPKSGQAPAHSLPVSREMESSLSFKANMIKLVFLPLHHLVQRSSERGPYNYAWHRNPDCFYKSSNTWEHILLTSWSPPWLYYC